MSSTILTYPFLFIVEVKLDSTGGMRKRFVESPWQLEKGDLDALVYQIKDIVTIDILNDRFLSTLFFSISEHDSVRYWISRSVGDECKEGATRLLELMELCSVTIVGQFCTEMESIDKGGIIKDLNLRQKYCGRLEQTLQSSTPGTVDGETDPKDSKMLLSKALKSIRDVKTFMKENLSFNVDDVCSGSIIIRLYPESEQSWTELKDRCLAGNIDEIFDAVFSDEAFSFLTGVEYKLVFTIYSQKDTGNYLSQIDNKRFAYLGKYYFLK